MSHTLKLFFNKMIYEPPSYIYYSTSECTRIPSPRFYRIDERKLAKLQHSNDLYHGVILENGELAQYNFPGAVETFLYGISDATGALTGNFIDASGIRRGFSGDAIVEFPGWQVCISRPSKCSKAGILFSPRYHRCMGTIVGRAKAGG